MIKLTTQQLHAAAKIAQAIGRIDDELKDDGPFGHAASAQYELAGQTFFITLEQARAALVERRERLVQDLARLGIEWGGNLPLSVPSSWVSEPIKPTPQPKG